MRKILVFGASGMLGYAVSEYFDRKGFYVSKISRNEFDIAKDSHSKLNEIIKDSDYVINCAGIIKSRIDDLSIEEILLVNSIFPQNLAKACKQENIKCFHITTDCAFDGKTGNYSEDDLFDAEDVYGMSKIGGDSADCMILRTSIVGEEKGQNRSLLHWAKSQAGKEVNGFTNHIWNGVTTVYLSEIIEKIINENLYKNGLFHIHSPQSVTKFELLQIFNEVYQLNLKINPTDGKPSVDRSLSSIYNINSELVKKTIKEQVFEMREFFI
ncbi:MAG: SDR family oxidoreductase [Bacteroidetes bacterium]|nr:SDR family oxidoreductase [Bacteroidota bacterium]MBU1115187.1 SDR family oxidoreductase [Bacteroidota bacterium]MBU1799358.1 SDR family oxidoreductase [Bacteroidota bacterium]